MNFLKNNKPELIVTTEGKVLYSREGYHMYEVDTLPNSIVPYASRIKEIIFHSVMQKCREIDQYIYKFPTTVSSFSLRDDLINFSEGLDVVIDHKFDRKNLGESILSAKVVNGDLTLTLSKRAPNNANPETYYVKSKSMFIELVDSSDDPIHLTYFTLSNYLELFTENPDLFPYSLAALHILLITEGFGLSLDEETEKVVREWSYNLAEEA